MSDYERSKQVDEKFCESCGAIIKQAAEICPQCGVRAKPYPYQFSTGAPYVAGAKQRMVYILLGVFLGNFGIHNFYAGYTNKGIAQLVISLTLGWVFGLGVLISWVWAIIDIVTITVDANGYPMY
jgi:TM2 domain-containing membrane protein YozV